ncbi:hypothetical protein ACFYXM_35095 [Streptomyces sp. NPDC002476]|uniref:hypothetical protein n=1 Tax=Streptomyces sp. NPDC002476 TaxID=3364648 RepID=UPI0036A3E91D
METVAERPLDRLSGIALIIVPQDVPNPSGTFLAGPAILPAHLQHDSTPNGRQPT